MTIAHHRPKAPDQVKAALINAAVDLLDEGSPVSIGAVADAAGVTKGAVQHHFGNREQLMLALMEELCSAFEQRLIAESTADKHHCGAAARAYLRLAAQTSPEDIRHSRALLSAAVMERKVAVHWREWMGGQQQADAGTPEQELGRLICRLVADGLWLSDVLGIYQIDDAERERLVTKIQSMTR